MRAFLLAIACAVSVPGTSLAAGTRLASRELSPAGGTVSARFDLVGVHWQGPGTVEFRTGGPGGLWSAWQTAAPEAEDLPDTGTKEARRSAGWRVGNPFWAGASDRLQYRPRGTVSAVRAYFVASPVQAVPPATLDLAGPPPIITRAAWKADESIRRGEPQYADAVRFSVVHHTAGTNNYSAAESASIVRAIELYHVQGNGWNDVGYNYLVDKYGQVFEGRYGGLDRNVVGAHAIGFNTGSAGVAVIGSYESTDISPAARAALVRLLAWRLDIAHVDPLAEVTWASGGNSKFPEGTPVTLRSVSGHRDTGDTDCPGDALYAMLDSVARSVSATGQPKLYDAFAAGAIGEPVRFTGRLSKPETWTVTVASAASKATVATGTGAGTTIDWTWDSATATASAYRWTMDAGPDVREARGFVGAAAVASPPPVLRKPPPLLLSARVGPAVLSPNADGYADTAAVSYRLTRAAYVTATVSDPGGAVLTTLFRAQRQSARTQTFGWAADVLPDGRYVVTIAARGEDGKQAKKRLLVRVDRTLGWFVSSPSAFSPNGDGAADNIVFGFRLAVGAPVMFRVLQYGKVVTEFYVGPLAPGPQRVLWDGSSPAGQLRPGRYVVVFEAEGPRGTVDLRGRFTVT